MEPNSSEDDIVYVPVPRRFLPDVYQSLAVIMGTGPSDDLGNQAASSGKRNVIDLVIPVAMSIGGDRHSVTLGDLHAAYLRTYPGIGKGETRNSFDAIMIYHCINMRSRFPDASHKQKRADWNTHPVFKRVGHAQYMLLSLEEVEAFHFLLERNYPGLYADEYEADLLLQWFHQQKEE